MNTLATEHRFFSRWSPSIIAVVVRNDTLMNFSPLLPVYLSALTLCEVQLSLSIPHARSPARWSVLLISLTPSSLPFLTAGFSRCADLPPHPHRRRPPPRPLAQPAPRPGRPHRLPGPSPPPTHRGAAREPCPCPPPPPCGPPRLLPGGYRRHSLPGPPAGPGRGWKSGEQSCTFSHP